MAELGIHSIMIHRPTPPGWESHVKENGLPRVSEKAFAPRPLLGERLSTLVWAIDRMLDSANFIA